MHIWTIENWKSNLDSSDKRRTGLRLRIENTVDEEVKRACKDFAKWLRMEYYFPLRLPVYIKSSWYIRTMDGDNVVGSFFEPYEFNVEPYIRIATGDYIELVKSNGRDDALASILISIAHEITHYYQWINGLKLTPVGRERQATYYSRCIIDEYASTRDHP